MDMPHYIKRLVAIQIRLALTVLVVISIGCSNQEAVENDLNLLYQQATADLAKFKNELAREQKLEFNTVDIEGRATEQQREKISELQQNLEELLNKLIALNPPNEEYRFELARLTAAKGDHAKSMEMLKELSPEDAPGYPPAHFLLAKVNFEKQALSGRERQGNLNVVLQHLEHILSRKEFDPQANLLKAQTLTLVGRFDEAYEVYELLFEASPKLYRQMAALNKQLKREERNPPLFEKALTSFLALAEDEEIQSDNKRWIVTETGITKTLQGLDRFQDAETRLLELIARYEADPKGGPRRVFLQRLIADTYVLWAGKVAGQNANFDSLPDATLKEIINLHEKAYQNHPDNSLALQNLTRLSLSSNTEIASQAKAVYDPMRDINAPAAVLNQIGNHMLIKKNFSDAIRYYERAREKSPRDPAILNNLAFAYLVADEDEFNPERGFQLVNEAIRHLPQNLPEIEKAKFLHTKATALKKMDRLKEALMAYEKSLKARPNHADTLRSLIECYNGLNRLPPELYVSRLAEIEQQN